MKQITLKLHNLLRTVPKHPWLTYLSNNVMILNSFCLEDQITRNPLNNNQVVFGNAYEYHFQETSVIFSTSILSPD